MTESAANGGLTDDGTNLDPSEALEADRDPEAEVPGNADDSDPDVAEVTDESDTSFVRAGEDYR